MPQQAVSDPLFFLRMYLVWTDRLCREWLGAICTEGCGFIRSDCVCVRAVRCIGVCVCVQDV